ncbi:EAL domain-containing protein [Marinomonas sp. C2222]|uniref:EAL domain-containing protein n=1 Tax=Marinomonas sargassi TaxID=2984494 RepID=A0ABT2YVR9_9GAMM|nr:EAL domain-containing protein [Marinomonas sargassi]MCV2403995.1 EAL domain-containing protein [Marinomonas sargassi]
MSDKNPLPLIPKIVDWIISYFYLAHDQNDYAAKYQSHQFLNIVKSLPLTCLISLFVVLASLMFTWDKGHNEFALVYVIALSVITFVKLSFWWSYVIKHKHLDIHQLPTKPLALTIIASAISYAFLSCYWFTLILPEQEVFFVLSAAAFVVTGCIIFSRILLIGATWAVGFSGGFVLAYAYLFGSLSTDIILFTLIGVLSLSLICLSVTRHHVQNFKRENQVEMQRQAASVLLNDFEEKASDWLWEVDKYGHLQYVSQKLTQATGSDSQNLLHFPFVNILESLLDTEERNALEQLQKVNLALSKRADFSNILLPIKVNNETLWWSLSAKIITDNQDTFIGWRGVTKDRTSAVLPKREMIKQANTDSLTGIGNRLFFNDQLTSLFTKSTTSESVFALVLMDLDNFKMINDSFGHNAGDDLLIEVSNRLKNNIPENAILSRLNGDEFAIVIPNTSSSEKIEELSTELYNTIIQPWSYGNSQINISISLGIAFSSDSINSIEGLLRAGDLALNDAKQASSRYMSFFNTEMEVAANHRGQVVNEMKQSIFNNEFILDYQPQLDLSTGQLIGAEALVRWKHPKRGMIAPLNFIPIAEESDLISFLGVWILEKACSEAATWPDDLYVAVNVSCAQIEKTDLLSDIKRILEETQLPPSRLEIEITESVLITDKSPVFNFLTALREMGIKIALDDFGTGYSSLSYLHDLPIDKLKIDRSFINQSDADEKSRSIIRSITHLASSLKVSTIAEGIETEDQYDLLSSLGVQYGQGYWYARPMTPESFKEFIEAKKA